MNNKNNLILWKPIEVNGKNFFLHALINDDYGLQIEIRQHSTNIRIEILFHYFFSYRNTNESYLLNIWHGNDKSLLGNVFYKIENSSYIESLQEMSIGFDYNFSEWTHFCIFTNEDCIEVLTTDLPIVRIM